MATIMPRFRIVVGRPHPSLLDAAWRRQYASKLMRASSRKLVVLAVGLGVVAFLLYRSRSFFHFGDFSGAKLLHAVRDANLFLLALSVLAIYGCYAPRSLRWEVFQR